MIEVIESRRKRLSLSVDSAIFHTIENERRVIAYFVLMGALLIILMILASIHLISDSTWLEQAIRIFAGITSAYETLPIFFVGYEMIRWQTCSYVVIITHDNEFDFPFVNCGEDTKAYFIKDKQTLAELMLHYE